MKDTPVFDDVPEFSPDGTNVKPGTAKYSGGWVSGEILPFDYANWLFNGLTKNGVVGGESLASVHAELKALLTLFGLTPSDLSDSQIAEFLNSIGITSAGVAHAADATHADDADNAAHADDSSTVGGVDPVDGNAGTWGSAAIANQETYVLPAGTYIFAGVVGVNLKIKIPNTSNWAGSGTASGLIISDGVNYAIFNNTGNISTYYFRKLA